jgi:hypothetical protein
LQQTATSTKERTAAAHAKHERYLSHVQRLEEEVAAAKQHADAAAAELQQAHAEETTANRALASLHQASALARIRGLFLFAGVVRSAVAAAHEAKR